MIVRNVAISRSGFDLTRNFNGDIKREEYASVMIKIKTMEKIKDLSQSKGLTYAECSVLYCGDRYLV